MSSLPILKICLHNDVVIITKFNTSSFSITAIFPTTYLHDNDTVLGYLVFHDRDTPIELGFSWQDSSI